MILTFLYYRKYIKIIIIIIENIYKWLTKYYTVIMITWYQLAQDSNFVLKVSRMIELGRNWENKVSSLTSDCDLKGVKSTANEKNEKLDSIENKRGTPMSDGTWRPNGLNVI